MKDHLQHYGVWKVADTWTPDLAHELEAMGFGALWIGGSKDSGLHLVEELLQATDNIVVATGIVNVWSTDADIVSGSFQRIEQRFPGRFLLGIGVGHRESNQNVYEKPYSAVKHYLDRLDAGDVPADRRVLAALGPDMVRLSGRRALGAHPYLTIPAHTNQARELLGPLPLLAPEQKVVLGSDAGVTRAIGRAYVNDPYLQRVNYRNNLQSLGYTEDEMNEGGSDRLIDDLVLQGSASQVAERLQEGHLAAGADHVAIQLLADGAPTAQSYRELAHALGLRGAH